jgi:ATP phosphoribosyltransferase
MASKQAAKFRLALPGKGALESATMAFLAECGMKVNRRNPRQYLASMKSMPAVEVVFQRAADIPALVESGDAAMGITGYDLLAEHRGYGDDLEERDHDEHLMVLQQDLGYGSCRLVVAVPETWIDVSTCADLWHLAGYYQQHKGRGLRIATKYPILTGQFLRRHHITHCKIFSPHGALEAAPLTDTADLIVDLTETGTTLRENHLKLLADGDVLRSQACLVGNSRLLSEQAEALKVCEIMLELIEARVQARNRSLINAHVRADVLGKAVRSASAPGEEDPDVVQRLTQRLKTLTAGIEFRARQSGEWFTLSGVMNVGHSAPELLATVAVLRGLGAEQIDVVPLSYCFGEASGAVRALHERLKRM